MSKVIGPAIALLLLALYGYSTWIVCHAGENLDAAAAAPTILNLVGALLAALVISVLAVTPVGHSPASTLAYWTRANWSKWVLEVFVALYLVGWLACGTYLVWVWLQAGTAPLVATAAKSWLGLAVGAGYAYFNLKPAGTALNTPNVATN